MAKEKTNNTEQVNLHISKLDKKTADIVNELRKIILETDKELAEHIKWNSPAFYYAGAMKDFDPKEYKRDLLVINLARGKILLVFPTGARVKDGAGILEGSYTDGRRLVTIKDMADLSSKKMALKKVVSEWLKLIEK